MGEEELPKSGNFPWSRTRYQTEDIPYETCPWQGRTSISVMQDAASPGAPGLNRLRVLTDDVTG